MNNPINPKYLNPEKLHLDYKSNQPFSHIILDDFIDENLLKSVLSEFPDLSNISSKIEYKNSGEVKFTSKGFSDIQPKAFELISYLNSDIFLKYLQTLTGVKEVLISDPYLSGGGYHEIKNSGFLKVHVDFTKHPYLNLDRRINLLLYLNTNWDNSWGGSLKLYDQNDLQNSYVDIEPQFNRCVIFSTTSFTYHGNPDPLNCPNELSRKSIALYYFSQGRPESEVTNNNDHGTFFILENGEKIKKDYVFKTLMVDFIPPILHRFIRKIAQKVNYRNFLNLRQGDYKNKKP